MISDYASGEKDREREREREVKDKNCMIKQFGCPGYKIL